MTPVAAKILKTFDPKTFLSTIDGGRKIVAFSKIPKSRQSLFRATRPMPSFIYRQEG
jgi:hypothetical protein